MAVQVTVDDTKAPRRKLLVLERFDAAVTSVALEVSGTSRVSLVLELAGLTPGGAVAAGAALIDAAGAIVAAGAH